MNYQTAPVASSTTHYAYTIPDLNNRIDQLEKYIQILRGAIAHMGSSLVQYTDNTTALAALGAGKFYKTGDDVKVTHV